MDENGGGERPPEVPALRAAAVPKGDLSECPPLPAAAWLDPALGTDASPWLDDYLRFSRQWAPRGYVGFHVNSALNVLSTTAARRIKVHMGGERFTNLTGANCARSSIFTKSTVHGIGDQTMRAAGLEFLLAPDDATPEALLNEMGRRSVPEDWETLTLEDRAIRRLYLAFAGQKGWSYDEFGMKVQAMMKDSGPMSAFRGILRRLDDCPDVYKSATIGRGIVRIDKPYLALIASLTPADMAPFAKRGGPLWNDGFWARFCFAAPAPDATPSDGEFPVGQRIIPSDITMRLRQWHEKLGVPEVEISEVFEDEPKAGKTKQWRLEVAPLPQQVCILAHGVREAFYRYHNSLCYLTQATSNTDLDGSYTRFAEKALRVAALLASLENGGIIDMRHWTRAQMIAEDWRQSLHNLYAVVNASSYSEEAEREDQVIKIVGKLGNATPADVRRFMKNTPTADITRIMTGLATAGALQRSETTHKGTPKFKLT